MMFRINSDDIARSSTLDNSDWNKYAVIHNGCIIVCGSKNDAEVYQKIIMQSVKG